jgi:hypothetical protein
MNRVAVLTLILLAPSPATFADEIRHITFPNALLGTWAETSEQCAAKDKSNIVIENAKYGDASGSCDVRWIVETPASRGTNYAVHALCASASKPTDTQTVNIIIRPQSNDRAVMGRSFETLRIYQRCPE